MKFGKRNVCAVVVTYFPDADFLERLKKISAQVDHVILVDNGSTGKALETIDRISPGDKSYELIQNNENLGIAAALNQGARKAMQYDYPWVITFDQDSVPADDMILRMLNCWEIYPKQQELMILGPEVRIRNFSSNPGILSNNDAWSEVTHVITSGSLIASRAFESAGYFLDSLFIDYVDIEYCLRLRGRGYKIIQVKDALLHHRLGRIEKRRILWKNVHPSHHDAQRRYYQYRNAVLLHKCYKKTLPEWCKFNRIVLFKMFFVILLYEKQKVKKIQNILIGTFHGLMGRAGRNGEIAFFSNGNIPSHIKSI
jgi:rhamnosyltransferase